MSEHRQQGSSTRRDSPSRTSALPPSLVPLLRPPPTSPSFTSNDETFPAPRHHPHTTQQSHSLPSLTPNTFPGIRAPLHRQTLPPLRTQQPVDDGQSLSAFSHVRTDSTSPSSDDVDETHPHIFSRYASEPHLNTSTVSDGRTFSRQLPYRSGPISAPFSSQTPTATRNAQEDASLFASSSIGQPPSHSQQPRGSNNMVSAHGLAAHHSRPRSAFEYASDISTETTGSAASGRGGPALSHTSTSSGSSHQSDVIMAGGRMADGGGRGRGRGHGHGHGASVSPDVEASVRGLMALGQPATTTRPYDGAFSPPYSAHARTSEQSYGYGDSGERDEHEGRPYFPVSTMRGGPGPLGGLRETRSSSAFDARRRLGSWSEAGPGRQVHTSTETVRGEWSSETARSWERRTAYVSAPSNTAIASARERSLSPAPQRIRTPPAPPHYYQPSDWVTQRMFDFFSAFMYRP